MTLQRRLLALLLFAVPLIWASAVVTSLLRARLEIHELFDTQQIRLAQQVLTLVLARGDDGDSTWVGGDEAAPAAQGPLGDAELKDLSVSVWSRDGRRHLADREGALLPPRDLPSGFEDLTLAGEPWRVYYLRSARGDWTVAVGQAVEERDELLQGLLLGQLLPWILMLPVLLVALALVVRHALKPVRLLAADLSDRGPDDLHRVETAGLPEEVRPLVQAMNRLFDKIRRTLEHERRLTADAAHELRTPLAALRAQWEAARVADDPARRNAAFMHVGEGIVRLERVVTQLLALSGVEARPATVFAVPVRWPRVVQDAMSDCLPLIEASGADVDVDWPREGETPFPLAGDDALLTLLVRNLIDNALRSGGRRVQVRIASDALVVEDDGPGVTDAVLARLGDRFFRPPGQAAPGSGLGLSIVRRVAELHGLTVQFGRSTTGGLRVALQRA
ncbi:MAG TPA: ATP-binding protein [Casimicrobiaceae bacterium]|nr:ATP-binding protein [Casimicrobiaceae bacterium]